MGEVGVAFPNDETSAEIIASRLRAGGVAARVDRGIYGSYQVGPRGNITVLVDEKHVRRAHKILGTTPHDASMPMPILWLGLAIVFAALALGVLVIIVLLARPV